MEKQRIQFLVIQLFDFELVNVQFFDGDQTKQQLFHRDPQRRGWFT